MAENTQLRLEKLDNLFELLDRLDREIDSDDIDSDEIDSDDFDGEDLDTLKEQQLAMQRFYSQRSDIFDIFDDERLVQTFRFGKPFILYIRDVKYCILLHNNVAF